MNKQGAKSTGKKATTHVLLDVTQTQVCFYENLLERNLLRGGMLPDRNAPVVLELEVEPGTPFKGCEVRELGLPIGKVPRRKPGMAADSNNTAGSALSPDSGDYAGSHQWAGDVAPWLRGK